MNTLPIPAFDAARLREYRLAVAVGHAESLQGRTELELSGDGRFQARQMGGRKRELAGAQGEVSPQALTQVLRAALQFGWQRDFPPRPGIPGEAIVEWTLTLPDGAALTMREWLRDVEQGAVSAPALQVLRDALQGASGGQLFL